MADDIQITISGTDAKLLSVWQRQNAEILKNQKALIAMGEAGEKAGKKTGESIEGATKQFGQFLTAVSGIGSVAGAVMMLAATLKREYDDLLNRQKRAADTQLGAAPAQREAIRNLGDDKTLTPDKLAAEVARISKKSGMDQAAVYQVASTALSFKERAASAASVLPLVEMAAGLNPENASAASANVKALQAIAKISPKSSAKDIQGFIMGGKLASPVVSDESYGSYIAPGIAQMMSLGNTGRQSAAFLGALGQGIGDEEGRITANAAITFQKQLLEETKGRVKGGVFEQLAYLQTPEGARIKKKLLGPLMAGNRNAKKIGLEGEAKAFATLIGFIKNEGRYAEILKGTYEDTPEIEGAGRFVDLQEQQLAGQPLQQQFRLNRMLQNTAGNARIEDILGGRTSITREGLQEIMASQGFGATDRTMAGLRFDFETGLRGKTPTDAATTILGEAADIRRNPGARGAADPASAAKLDEIAAALKEVARVMDRMRDRPIRIEADVPVQVKNGPGVANDRRAPVPVGGP